MNATKAVKIMYKFEKCPYCGNSKIGNGEGSVEVDENKFIRTCKCGCTVVIKTKE